MNLSGQNVFFDDLKVYHYSNLVVQEDHYYPFGMRLGGMGPKGDPEHNWKFNGKEKQDALGLQWYDFHARQYDPQLGRFHSADPMAHARNWVSPYNFVQNNPISRTDPTGMLDGEYVRDQDTGKETKVSNKGDKEGYDIVHTGKMEKDGSYSEAEGSRTEIREWGGSRNHSETNSANARGQLETASEFNNYANGVLGVFSQGMQHSLNTFSAAERSIPGFSNIANQAKWVGRAGIVGNISATTMSYMQMQNAGFSTRSQVNFGFDLGITITGAIPYAGPILSIGLGAYNAEGGFDQRKEQLTKYIDGVMR